MAGTRIDLDPYVDDPSAWGVSMAQFGEILLPCLDATGAQSVAEVGAYAGDLTRLLVDWAAQAGARVMAIDPSPQPQLVALDAERAELELVRKTSLEALPQIPLPDVVIIDGDHNYYTVTEELRLIADRAIGPALPLLLFHDVCWPHGRRDDYFAPEQIPTEHRQPLAGAGGMLPGEPGVAADGLPYPRSAAREGGPRNGVLTAVEDFVSDRDGVRLAIVPAFFGLGAVWHEDTSWGAEVAQILAPWDRNSLVGRLEASRVHQLGQVHVARANQWRAQERQTRQEVVLRRLLESSAFSVAERLSLMRIRAGVARTQSVVSKDEIRRALGD